MIKRKEIIFVAICIRQICLSTNYSNEKECIKYLFDKKEYYYLALIILKNNLDYSPNLWTRICDLILRRRQLSYLNLLLSYKILNEFYNFIILEKVDEEYVLNEINIPLRYLYDLYSNKLSFFERNFIDKIESFGQNTNTLFKYYSIEDLINKFHLQKLKKEYFNQ